MSTSMPDVDNSYRYVARNLERMLNAPVIHSPISTEPGAINYWWPGAIPVFEHGASPASGVDAGMAVIRGIPPNTTITVDSLRYAVSLLEGNEREILRSPSEVDRVRGERLQAADRLQGEVPGRQRKSAAIGWSAAIELGRQQEGDALLPETQDGRGSEGPGTQPGLRAGDYGSIGGVAPDLAGEPGPVLVNHSSGSLGSRPPEARTPGLLSVSGLQCILRQLCSRYPLISFNVHEHQTFPMTFFRVTISTLTNGVPRSEYAWNHLFSAEISEASAINTLRAGIEAVRQRMDGFGSVIGTRVVFP